MSHRVVCSLFRFVIAVCFFGVLTSAQANAGKPVAAVKADSHEFGLAYEGSDVTHEFIIKNTGDAPLMIQDVKTG